MQVIKQLEQGSPEWHAERLACVTGSSADEVMGTDLARVQLIARLIAEEGTEQSKMTRATPEMERGTYEEAFALKKFEEKTGKKIERVGICISDSLPWVKCSPDALIPDKKGKYTEAVEVKSPDSATVMFYKLTNEVGMKKLNLGNWSAVTKNNPVSTFKPSSKNPFLGIPADYKWQCINYFFVNEDLERLHFVVHDPRFIEEDQKMTVITIERSQPEVAAAIAEYTQALHQLRADWQEWRDIVLPSNF